MKRIEIKTEGIIPITVAVEFPDFVEEEFTDAMKKAFDEAQGHFELYIIAAIQELYPNEYKVWDH
jgi:hypothetical protein